MVGKTGIMMLQASLTKELQGLFRSVSEYKPRNHNSYIYGTYKYLDNPLNIIKNAYNMKIDTSQWQRNRDSFSRLYKSLRDAYIPHSDIAVMCGNPYLRTMQNWRNISYARQQVIAREYPEMPQIAVSFNDWLKEQALLCKFASERNGQCDDAFPDVIAAYTFVKTVLTSGVTGLSSYAKNLFKSRQITKTIEKNAPNLEKLPKLSCPKMADHHIFPQKYRPMFKKLGIDIDKYTVSLGNTTHLRGIHGKGNAGMPGRWNERWKEFFAKKLNPTAKEVYQFAGKLMDEYGINKEILHAYRK